VARSPRPAYCYTGLGTLRPGELVRQLDGAGGHLARGSIDERLGEEPGGEQGGQDPSRRADAPRAALDAAHDRLTGAADRKVFDNPAFSRARGRDGRTLDQAWQGSPRAYLGATIAGFPNLFLLVGPNSAGGYNSILFTTEAHVNYAIEATSSRPEPGGTVAGRPAAPGTHNDRSPK
jgi:hypothetical protein